MHILYHLHITLLEIAAGFEEVPYHTHVLFDVGYVQKFCFHDLGYEQMPSFYPECILYQPVIPVSNFAEINANNVCIVAVQNKSMTQLLENEAILCS